MYELFYEPGSFYSTTFAYLYILFIHIPKASANTIWHVFPGFLSHLSNSVAKENELTQPKVVELQPLK
jgi:hypothetical protein